MQAGDLITTSAVKGYGEAQGDDAMRACTVAKLTMGCDFSPAQVSTERVKKDASTGSMVLDPMTGGPVWEADEELAPAYKLRYVWAATGEEASAEEFAESAGDGSVLRAALLGCTYHCG